MADAGESDGVEPLTDEQMRDLVPVAHPQTAAEAAFIVSVLEDNEIPCVSNMQSFSMSIGGGGGEIHVPRVLLGAARSVLENVRRETDDMRIDDAFKIENIEETVKDTEKDPILTEMFELLDAEDDERDEALVPYILNWTAAGISDVQIARYLAAAGLSRDEAATLLDKTLASKQSELASTRFHYQVIGYSCIGLGLLLFVFRLIVSTPDAQWPARVGAAGLLTIVIGVCTLVGASRTAPTLAKRKSDVN
jgi:hypothetical protein